MSRRLAALLGVLTFLYLLYVFLWTPWFLSWGASREESVMPLPGDALVEGARVSHTRAITIEVPSERVWPWVAQLGQDRGGFYSYEVLEDLAGTRMTNADRILADRQQWAPGDALWMYPPGRFDAVAAAPMRAHVPGEALAFVTHQLGTPTTAPHDGSWAFALQRPTAYSTRLLIRSRAAAPPAGLAGVFDAVLFQPMHFVMERKLMEELAARAEDRGGSSYLRDTLEVLSWILVGLLGVVASVRVLRDRRWRRSLAVVGAAGLAFQVLTFVQPGPLLGLLTAAALALVLWQHPEPC